MRAIHSNIITELEKVEFTVFHLLHIVVGDTHYRFTDCDRPIVFDGNAYTPRGFTPDSVLYSSARVVDELRLEIDNLDNLFTAAFVGGTPRGASVTLKAVVLDSNGQVVADTVTSEDTSWWQINGVTLDVEPLVADVESDSIKGLWDAWEDSLGDLHLVPIAGDAEDELWKRHAVTNGLTPK